MHQITTTDHTCHQSPITTTEPPIPQITKSTTTEPPIPQISTSTTTELSVGQFALWSLNTLAYLLASFSGYTNIVINNAKGHADMDTSAGQGLYLLHHCKTLHLVRHAQGYHNVAGEKDFKAYLSYDYLDASLTSRGWEQVDNLRKHVQGSGLSKKFDLVITSPLTRTIQTAVGVFGGGSYNDGVDVAPLMVADAGNSGRPAISSFGCPPFLAVESCRDHLGVHPCNKRRTKSEYETLFPAIDFSLIENDDILWKEDVRETDEELAERGMKFLKWLWTRSEKEIAIVSHSGFLFHTLRAFGNDCHQVVKDEICTHFANCELRSMVFVDKSMASSDSSETNFPGKIPNGPDLPSDAADEKLT